MKPSSELLPHAVYVRELRPLLPAEAFAAQPSQLWVILGHYLIVITGFLLLRLQPQWGLCILASLLIGHSFGCIGFLAHDLSHNSIVKNRTVRSVLEAFLWATILIPATMWKRVHNQSHHVETNTLNDPDRECLESEKRFSTLLYSRTFYPHRKTIRWNPMVGFHLIPYVIRNVVAALFQGVTEPVIVPFTPIYSLRQRVTIFLELLLALGMQVGVFFAVGGRWREWVWASPSAYLVTSTVVMAYIFTNHFLNPLCEHSDPVVGSTSVEVPKFFDVLHDNFSYHTEHHLFPGMNPKYYPLVCRLLRDKFSNRYNRLSLWEAWRRLWDREEFIHTESKFHSTSSPPLPLIQNENAIIERTNKQ